jgi:hypothetical protein
MIDGEWMMTNSKLALALALSIREAMTDRSLPKL